MNKNVYSKNVFSIYFSTMVFPSRPVINLSPDETFPEFPIYILEFSDYVGFYKNVTLRYHEDARFEFDIEGFPPHYEEVNQIIFIWECHGPYTAVLI